MPEIPPEGPALPFVRWTREVVDELRTRLSDVRATRRGAVVTVIYRGRQVTIEDRRTHVVVWTGDRVMLSVERHDLFTAGVTARTLAAHFDVERWGRAD